MVDTSTSILRVCMRIKSVAVSFPMSLFRMWNGVNFFGEGVVAIFFLNKKFEWWRSQLFTVSHFGSANITTQSAFCQVGSPRRSPRFLNKSENRQNLLQFIFLYYSAFCLNNTFKSIRIHSETQVLVAPHSKSLSG